MKYTYIRPRLGYYSVYRDMLNQSHLMIAGATGSGKSVVISGIIHTALLCSPESKQFILIDPKRVELVEYKDLPHTIKYASEPGDMIDTLHYAMALVDLRYKTMQERRERKYTGGDVYVIIDELADLMTMARKEVEPLIQRLCQIGRAAKVHVIAATQCPLSCVISTPIKVNMDARVALRTRNAQDSRNIMDCTGCESLPRYGEAYYITPDGTNHIKVPMYTDADRNAAIDHWMRPAAEWLHIA